MFIVAHTWNHPYVGYHYLEIGGWVDMAMGFFYYIPMNEIMTSSIVN